MNSEVLVRSSIIDSILNHIKILILYKYMQSDQILAFFIAKIFYSITFNRSLFFNGLLQYYFNLLSVSTINLFSWSHRAYYWFSAKLLMRSLHRSIAFFIATKLGYTNVELGSTCAASLIGFNLSGSVYQL